MVHPTFRVILFIMFFLCETIAPKSTSKQLQIESYRISMRKLRTFYGKVTEFLKEDKSAAFGTSIHNGPFYPKKQHEQHLFCLTVEFVYLYRNGYLLMSLEKVVRKNGFSFRIKKNPCPDFLQAGTGTNLHKFFLGLFCQTVIQ